MSVVGAATCKPTLMIIWPPAHAYWDAGLTSQVAAGRIADAWHRRFLLFRGWALAVVLGAVGLAVVFATPLGQSLNTGLPFRPVPTSSAVC